MPYTITITEVGGALIYTGDEGGAGAGCGATNGPKSHRVFRNCAVLFTSPEGPIGILFKGKRRPFKPPNDIPADQIQVSAAMGATTLPLTVKNNLARRKVRYFAALAKGGAVFVEDPDLEDGGDGGGGPGPRRKTKAAKKPAKKKTKK